MWFRSSSRDKITSPDTAAGSTRSDDPRYDYDLTGYGIISTWGSDHERPEETTGYWEPKVAFDDDAAWNQARREPRT